MTLTLRPFTIDNWEQSLDLWFTEDIEQTAY